MIDIEQAAGHVKDADVFHVPGFLWDQLPEAWQSAHRGTTAPLPAFDLELLGGYTYHLQLTKFMVLEVVAAVLMIMIFVPLAGLIATGWRPRGKIWNFFEAMLVFIRDEVARPAIGRHDADRFLPFIWNIFFFVLFCNLLGMVPWAGSPTGALGVTGALALVTFGVVLMAGMFRYGLIGFWTGMVPHMELPLVLAVILKPMLMVIEIAGLIIKHCVLGVRLLANMFAGHLVLAVIVGFIAGTAEYWLVLWVGVTFFSVLGATALSLLELFVAFLQAYIFAFLSALFIGMAVHQH